MPEKIGSYTVVSQLGRGGMGVVYKGRDESLNRFVAIKVLTETLSDDPTFLQRFVREAQAAAALSHPNVVQIYFTGEDEAKRPYFVMEYVSGQSLDQLLRSQGRIDNPRASQMILQAAHGLAAAHDLGIIHRDIKPANLILDDRGIVKIADFGLALPADAETQLTATGMMVGTPGYLSPEQFDGHKADHLTDIYALGITYYMLLTGTPPFRGESPLALMKQIVDANPPDVSTVNPGVDPESRRILAKMIAKDRAQRYQNCHDLVADLENLLATMGVRSMTAGLVTRTTSAGANADAMSAPTLVVSRDVTQPMVASKAAITSPGMPMTAAPTKPAMEAPVPPKKSSSTRVVLVAALFAFILLAGGAIGAVWYGRNLLLARRAAPPAEVAKQPVAAPAANPPREVLLSQAVTPVATQTQPAEPSAPAQPQSAPRETATVAAPARTVAAEPVAAVREPKRRALSGVAVAAIGDQALLGAVSSVLRVQADAAGVEAADAHGLPATEDLLRGRAAVRDLIAALRDDGYAVLMLARIEPTGERQLSYYGRRDTQYSARVTVTAYDLASGRPIGSSQSAEIQYTSINIESESEDVVAPLARAVAQTIRNR